MFSLFARISIVCVSCESADSWLGHKQSICEANFYGLDPCGRSTTA